MDEAESAGQQTHGISFPRLRGSPAVLSDLIKSSSRILDVTRHIGASCIVANTIRTSVYTAFASTRTDLPWVWCMRDFWLSESRPKFLLIDKIGKWIISNRANLIVANSQAVAENLPAREKIHVVHNGLDTDNFYSNVGSAWFKSRYEIPENARVIGMVGRLRPWKGVDRFLRIAAQVHLRFPSAVFLVVGGSPFNVRDGYAATLPLLAHELGIEDVVIFTGHLEDVRPALAVMDIFVHPGEPEPFGRVNIEAMAMQLPVVGFRHGALPEIVIDGKTGILALPYDETALVRGILDLLESHEKSARLGQSGRSRVQSVFTENKMVEEFSAVLSLL